MYFTELLNIRRPSLHCKWKMPKVRESAVSYLMQCALPQSNILFIIGGNIDVQTLIKMPNCNFLPYHSRNEIDGEGHSGATFLICRTLYKLNGTFDSILLKSICWKPDFCKTCWQSLQKLLSDCYYLTSSSGVHQNSKGLPVNIYTWSLGLWVEFSQKCASLHVGLCSGNHSDEWIW